MLTDDSGGVRELSQDLDWNRSGKVGPSGSGSQDARRIRKFKRDTTTGCHLVVPPPTCPLITAKWEA